MSTSISIKRKRPLESNDIKTSESTDNKKPRIKYTFDILYDDSMVDRFIKFYQPLIEKKNLDKHTSKTDMDLNKKFKDYIKLVIDNKLWEDQKSFECNSKYKLNDDVTITYSPFSQKYIDYYEDKTFSGKIFYIDSDTDNMLLIERSELSKKDEIVIKSLEQNGCHYFGINRGYEYFIKKID